MRSESGEELGADARAEHRDKRLARRMRARVIPAGGEERLFGKRPARVRAVSVGEADQLPRQARAGAGRVIVRQIELKEKALPARVLQLRLFLCDEHYGDLTDEQRAFARQGRDKMRSVYAELCVRLLQSEIMLERGMVPDSSTYRSVFCTEGGDAPWMIDRAG